MPRVLIAGCGYVGSAAADFFAGRGWEVEGWTHSAESAAKLAAAPYPVRAVDIAQRENVAAAAAKFDAVIHCASSGGGGPDGYRRVYLAGARHLLEVLRPSRFIFTSSTSVYAQRDGAWVDETSAAEPTHETGRILREAEEFVRQNGGVNARLAGIYGPGRSAFLRKFLAGEAQMDGDGARFLNHAQRDDIVRALFFLTTETLEGDRVFNVCDDEPITQRAAYEWLAQKFQRPLPPAAEQSAPRKRGTSNKRVRNHRLRALGWSPRFPDFASGMEAIIPSVAEDGA